MGPRYRISIRIGPAGLCLQLSQPATAAYDTYVPSLSRAGCHLAGSIDEVGQKPRYQSCSADDAHPLLCEPAAADAKRVT